MKDRHRKHLAETSHGLKSRPGRPHIPSQTFHELARGQNSPVDCFEAEKAIASLQWQERRVSTRQKILLYPFGALAQLGERLICIQEVNGSIPLGSTKVRVGSSGG